MDIDSYSPSRSYTFLELLISGDFFMLLSEMTWKDIAALDRSTIVVVPFGATEQHGLHLPLETDTLIGRELSTRLDNACNGRLLVLPTQWLGLSTHHMTFPGTLTASVETYLALATEIIGSIVHAGFQTVLVLNSHGGNASILDVVLTKLRTQHPQARITLVTYWNIARAQIGRLRESAVGGMGHACELETSLLLAAKPGLVRKELMQPDGRWSSSSFAARDMLAPGSASVSRSFDEISENGAVGDPSTASARKGELLFAAIVEQLVRVVHELEQPEQFVAVGVEKAAPTS
jgi:creatinine amidohydrolase